MRAGYIPEPSEQAVIEQIRMWREEGVSVAEICRRLTHAGVPSRTSGWYIQQVYRIMRYYTIH